VLEPGHRGSWKFRKEQGIKTGGLKDLKMKKANKRLLLLYLALMIVCAGTVSCGLVKVLEKEVGTWWKTPRPVVVQGTNLKHAANFSLITWIAGAQGTGSTAVLLRDRDPLFVELSEDNGAWLPYYWSDGSPLSVIQDENGTLLNSKRVVIDLSQDEQGLDWLEKADPREIAGLRACGLEEPSGGVGPRLCEALEKIHRVKPDMAWAVKGKEALYRVLELFDPPWLMIERDMPLHFKDMELISKERNLEYLSCGPFEISEGMSLKFPKSLRSLVLSKWHPEKTGPLPEDLKSLKALTILNSDMRDLAGIESLEGLEELHLVSCSKLTDLSALKDRHSLKALTLTDCKSVSDLSAIKDLKNLRWLGLPPATSQAQFDELMGAHPGLRVLELVRCKNIKDIKAVGSLKQLESLVVLKGRVDAARLGDLKNLRFLALSEESFEEAGPIEAIKKAHAGVLIVQAEPFCLGSGWILLLWPVLLTGWILARRRSGKGRSVERHA